MSCPPPHKKQPWKLVTVITSFTVHPLTQNVSKHGKSQSKHTKWKFQGKVNYTFKLKTFTFLSVAHEGTKIVFKIFYIIIFKIEIERMQKGTSHA